jgi:sugar phosphate isomerase/epimerase
VKLGYNTNGLAFHRWPDALELLAETGYRSVAITLDHHCLDPYSAALSGEVAQMQRLLQRYGLSSVIETGARFLLNPRIKHDPTLLNAGDDERALRLDFLKRAVDIAAELGSDAVSFWSGILRDPVSGQTAMRRLAEGCAVLAEHAAMRDVRLAFEPEPGMFIETFEQFERLRALVDIPSFGLTVDIGHVHCVEEGEIAPYLRAWGPHIFNIHIEDMHRGVHEHLRFGEGSIDFPPVMRALQEIGYAGGVHVELSRHSHMAPEVLRESYDFLHRYFTP